MHLCSSGFLPLAFSEQFDQQGRCRQGGAARLTQRWGRRGRTRSIASKSLVFKAGAQVTIAWSELCTSPFLACRQENAPAAAMSNAARRAFPLHLLPTHHDLLKGLVCPEPRTPVEGKGTGGPVKQHLGRDGRHGGSGGSGGG